jgi:ketosteroid isomerase-like protein
VRIVIFLFLFTTLARTQDISTHLSSLTSTERAFAAATKHIGVRNGFLTFFADDAITLRPTPGPYKDLLRKRLEPPQPLPTHLLWTPTEGDVASAGDLGWLTGPSAVRENKPGGHVVYTGQYFSIWKKQEDGTWKVLLDVGIQTPRSAADPETAPFAPHPLFSATPDTTARGTEAQLLQAERELNAAWARSGSDAATFYTPSARLHADGLMPLVAPNEVRKHISMLPGMSQHTLGSGCSRSGDLGYTYGSIDHSGRTTYYLRAWKFLKDDGWRVVVVWIG